MESETLTPPLAPARRRRKDARPAELVAAAIDLFVERGYAATRLDDVAARAGVSKGTLYLYFGSKEELFKAVIREGIVPALEHGESVVSNFEGSTTELLRWIIHGWWQLIGATRFGGIPKLMISEARNFPEVANFYHEAVIVRGRNLLGQVLKRGIESGEFRDLDIDVAIDVIFAPVLLLAIWRHSWSVCDAGHDPATYLDTHLGLLLDGLKANDPPRGRKPR